MTRNELIAAITLDFIKYNLDQEPDGTIRFCMVAWSNPLSAQLPKLYLQNLI
ncbi:Uncharacterised protein [Escherichia coli]|uniref:Uncharacterized protein n=1 Tax=Escherichia coli TaxID=562 RepID=A0A376TM64_ECOLX|nr:Uncharacterised protein [Escherichia coli]